MPPINNIFTSFRGVWTSLGRYFFAGGEEAASARSDRRLDCDFVETWSSVVGSIETPTDRCGDSYAEDQYDDCSEYFELRACELTDEMCDSLKRTETRDQTVAHVLRAKVSRKAADDDRAVREKTDALAEIRGGLDRNTSHWAHVRERILDRLKESLLPPECGGGDDNECWSYDGDEDVAELVAENARSAARIRRRRAKLDEDLAAVRRLWDQMDRRQVEIREFEKTVAESVDAYNKRRLAHDTSARAVVANTTRCTPPERRAPCAS